MPLSSEKARRLANFGCLVWPALVGVSFAGWITHIAYCFKHHAWGFLIAGAIAAPVGVIHGIGLWFGWWS